ncbi:hypothetical protein ACFL2Z_05900, partial [Candidatus Eisenbacteria bacterium]
SSWPDPAKIFDPAGGANSVEKAWHHLLSGYESGYMYYGTSLDMEIKPTLAANAAVSYADPVIAGGSDTVDPTIWLPQRLPWNPGGKGGGSLWGYPGGAGADMTSDFYVWTFAYDVSGLARVELRYRVDADGANSTSTDHNETYAGGADVGAWQNLAMNYRDFPKGNFFNDPSINFSVLPDYIADEYYVQVTGISEQLLDYYVEAEDSLGNIKRSPIQHVWVGTSSGSPSHVIDGSLDSTATLVASSGGFNLYADWDGEYLYLAAEGVGQTSSRDHFIIVGEDLSTPTASPWAKAGTVADRMLYMGNEDSNNWCGWFDDTETVITADAACASDGYLEGIVKLEAYLGSPLPDQVYLAVAGYASPDAGALLDQAPAGDGNVNVEADEYVLFPLATSGVDIRTDGRLLTVGPNPFRETTAINFTFPSGYGVSGDGASIEIHDIRGRTVASLSRAIRGRCSGTVIWDGRDRAGARVSPGIYFVKVASGSLVEVRRVVLVK